MNESHLIRPYITVRQTRRNTNPVAGCDSALNLTVTQSKIF